jgi:hypothetical protein
MVQRLRIFWRVKEQKQAMKSGVLKGKLLGLLEDDINFDETDSFINT